HYVERGRPACNNRRTVARARRHSPLFPSTGGVSVDNARLPVLRRNRARTISWKAREANWYSESRGASAGAASTSSRRLAHDSSENSEPRSYNQLRPRDDLLNRPP